jgi:hypothetical protein
MTLPSVLLGLLVSLLIGALFHLWRGGSLMRLLLYLALSVAGFAAGQWIGSWQKLIFLPVGALNLGMAATGSLVFLFGGYWLSLVEVRRPDRGKDDAV